MKVLVVSHSAVVSVYREKFQWLAKMGCEVHLVLPPNWPEGGRLVEAPPPGQEQEISIHVLPAGFVGKVGGFYLHGLGFLIRRLQPDIIHIEEEPFSLVAWQSLRLARSLKIPWVFFTWENILRTYKLPLQWIDRWVLRHGPWAIAGNQAAKEVLGQRGFRGQCTVIPQYGVDPEAYRPFTIMHAVKPAFTIGYFGRICQEKGLDTLLQAVRELSFSWRLHLVGNGPYSEAFRAKVKAAGLEKKVKFLAAVDNRQMPKVLQQADVLVLPSETTPAWKEQFGRVLIEAMACGIPVIGSDSGEIPNVIGEAGLIFPEQDWKTLAKHITTLRQDTHKAASLGKKGRDRVLRQFTTRHIAEHTLAWYRQMLGKA